MFSVKFGVCGYLKAQNANGQEFDLLGAVRRAGFDYIEFPLSTVAGLSEAEFGGIKEDLLASGLPCQACNIMFPRTVRLTGAEVDWVQVREYLELALGRAGELGAKVVVFGSAGARNVPEGFPSAQAWDQLIEMLRIADGIAEKNGITLTIEPLNRQESNIVNSVAEGYQLVLKVDRPRIQLLADFYHMSVEKEDPAIIEAAGAAIRHVHFADPNGRVYPVRVEENYRRFFAALKRADYQGRVSLEASFSDFERDASLALSILRECVN